MGGRAVILGRHYNSKIKDLLNEGRSLTDISRILNLPIPLLKNKCRELGMADKVKLVQKWTEEDDAKLKQLLDEGKSSSEIATLLNRTRNSVIGRSYRLSLAATVFFNEPQVKKFIKKDAKRKAEMNMAAADAIVSLKSGECKWPLGGHPTDITFRFCCAPQRAGSPYCEEHHKVSYYPSRHQLAERA